MLKGPSWKPECDTTGLSVLVAGLDVSCSRHGRARSRRNSLVTALAPKENRQKEGRAIFSESGGAERIGYFVPCA